MNNDDQYIISLATTSKVNRSEFKVRTPVNHDLTLLFIHILVLQAKLIKYTIPWNYYIVYNFIFFDTEYRNVLFSFV